MSVNQNGKYYKVDGTYCYDRVKKNLFLRGQGSASFLGTFGRLFNDLGRDLLVRLGNPIVNC